MTYIRLSIVKQYRLWGVPGPISFTILWIKVTIQLPIVPSPTQVSLHQSLLVGSSFPRIARRILILVNLEYGPVWLTGFPTRAFPQCWLADCTLTPHSSRSIISWCQISAIPYRYGRFQNIQHFCLLMERRAWYAVVLPFFLVSPMRSSTLLIWEGEHKQKLALP